MNKERFVTRFFLFYLPLTCILVFTLFPFIWTFITSIKPERELYTTVVRYWPESPTLVNYIKLFNNYHFLKYMGNSFLVAIITTVVTLCATLLAAYAFSRYEFKGKKFIMVSFLSINMFPAMLLLIPLYSIMRQMGILFTPGALVISYSTFTIPFSVWMLTGYLNDLPNSLEEAAMVDGCSRMGAFMRITLPLSVPGMVATGVYIFINAMNEFTFASMFTNEQTRTIPVALKALVGQFQIEWGMLTAGGVITILPIVIVFIFVQKKLVQGLTAGAVKG